MSALADRPSPSFEQLGVQLPACCPVFLWQFVEHDGTQNTSVRHRSTATRHFPEQLAQSPLYRHRLKMNSAFVVGG